MQNETNFFEVNKQDKNYNTVPNISIYSIYSIVSFKINSNNYSTDVFVKDFGWITLSIGFDNFNQLIVLHS